MTLDPRSQPESGRAAVDQIRFSEQELGLILKKAAELQEAATGSRTSRFSLAEIQEIAAEAGIDPVHVSAAAATVRAGAFRPRHLLLGAPSAFRFDQFIEGEVDDDVVGELIDLARRELGLQGKVTEALGTVEWSARESFGTAYVTVTRRAG